MDPFLISLLASSAPYAIDAITGASANKQKAIAEQNAVLNSIIADLTKQAGTSATDSAAFKAGQGVLDKSRTKAVTVANQNAAATGATGELATANIAAINDGYQDATLNNIQSADAVRTGILGNLNNMKLAKAGMGVQQAGEAVTQQNQLLSGFNSVVPSLVDGFGKPKPKYNAQTGKPIVN